jgi:hypothetical protein
MRAEEEEEKEEKEGQFRAYNVAAAVVGDALPPKEASFSLIRTIQISTALLLICRPVKEMRNLNVMYQTAAREPVSVMIQMSAIIQPAIPA